MNNRFYLTAKEAVERKLPPVAEQIAQHNKAVRALRDAFTQQSKWPKS